MLITVIKEKYPVILIHNTKINTTEVIFCNFDFFTVDENYEQFCVTELPQFL